MPKACLECDAPTYLEDMCRRCGCCLDCCECDDPAYFDAAEMGEEPEDEYERRTRG